MCPPSIFLLRGDQSRTQRLRGGTASPPPVLTYVCTYFVFSKSDPSKANQVERLGMGVAKKGGVSHSSQGMITVIDQEEPASSSSSFKSFSRKTNNVEDDFEIIGGGGDDWRSSSNNNSKFDFEPASNNWEKEFEVMKTTSKVEKPAGDDQWFNSFDEPAKKNTERYLCLFPLHIQ